MPIPRVYKTEAIVLRNLNYGEADRILTIFTPQHGKYRIIAKGARKITSKLAGSSDLLSRAQFLLAVGRELDVVTQGITLERFDTLRESLWHGTAAYTLAESIDRAIEESSENHSIYDLALETLRHLESDAREWLANPVSENKAGPTTRGWAVLRHFELRLLDELGYRPAFQKCVACDRPLEPVENNFNAELGGALCPGCGRLGQRRLPLLTLKVLRLMQRSTLDELPVMRLDAVTRGDVESVLHALLTQHFERSLRSWGILQH
jgi:DNA repair protein RecO (recombination protein O)